MKSLRHRVLSGALACTCSMLLVTSSLAATIEPGQGGFTLNQGQGFQPINSRVNANAGDSVMVGPGGSATIVYDDGCQVPVQPGAVATIAPLSPCASGSSAQDHPYCDPNNPGCIDWFDWQHILLYAGLGTVVGVAIYELTRPSSP